VVQYTVHPLTKLHTPSWTVVLYTEVTKFWTHTTKSQTSPTKLGTSAQKTRKSWVLKVPSDRWMFYEKRVPLAPSCSHQRTELLSGIISEQDLWTLRTACLCMHGLRIRVEARANTIERAVIDQQIQFMQTTVQPYPTEDLRTANTSCPSRTSAEHFT